MKEAKEFYEALKTVIHLDTYSLDVLSYETFCELETVLSKYKKALEEEE